MINLSLGGGLSSTLDAVVESAIAMGFFVVVAAGNNGRAAASPLPAAEKGGGANPPPQTAILYECATLPSWGG